jgi:hypothetical protein
MGEHILDAMATQLFQQAIREHRAGELLEHLFEGDGITHDPKTGAIIYIPHNVLQELSDVSDD